MQKKVELLAPAGSVDALKAAIMAGADAIYMGGSKFGARAFAENFGEDVLVESIEYAHLFNRKIYLTVNTLLKNQEMAQLYDYLLPYYKAGLDGVIVQDLGVVRYIRRMFPDMEVHASTQMTLTGSYGADAMKKLGITRIVPARELSLKEIRKIKADTGIEIECFIHGALCYCYSGQCLLSSVIGGRSGNRGQCAQPCRLPYKINGRTEDYMSLKDLSTIDILPQMIEAGIDSFKIEGRMKHPEYVYTVVSIYRKYIDLYYDHKETYKVEARDRQALENAFKRRGYTDGYYFRHNGKEMVSFKRPDNNEQMKTIEIKNLQRGVHASLYIRLGEPMLLSVYDDEHYVAAYGCEPQAAVKQPLDEARIKKQLNKTGNTLFKFDSITVDLIEDVFLPMQALNELRREALDLFCQEVLKQSKRELKCQKEEPLDQGSGDAENTFLSASVLNEKQFLTVLKESVIKRIYVDSSIALTDQVIRSIDTRKDIEFIFAAPYICRDKEIKRFTTDYARIEQSYDGILVRSMELLGFLTQKNYKKILITDYNLYTFNSEAVCAMKEQGITEFTSPVELNERELKNAKDKDSIFIAYGYQPVMISANCLMKTSNACKHQPSFLNMTDRYKNNFVVYTNCRECYNVIYNTSPLYLADMKDKLLSLGMKEYRLDFIRESEGEIHTIIKEYYTTLFTKDKGTPVLQDITRGHFKRGVK